MQGVSSQAEELLGAQEVPCSVEFIISPTVCVHVNWKRLKQILRLLISNFRCVLNVVFFLLGDSPAVCADVSEHSVSYIFITPPMKMEQSVPKRRYIKFRPQGMTQKKE